MTKPPVKLATEEPSKELGRNRQELGQPRAELTWSGGGSCTDTPGQGNRIWSDAGCPASPLPSSGGCGCGSVSTGGCGSRSSG